MNTPDDMKQRMSNLTETKLADFMATFNKCSSDEARVRFVLLLLAAQAAIHEVLTDQLRDEIAALRMCVPKADLERATKAMEQANAEAAGVRKVEWTDLNGCPQLTVNGVHEGQVYPSNGYWAYYCTENGPQQNMPRFATVEEAKAALLKEMQ